MRRRYRAFAFVAATFSGLFGNFALAGPARAYEEQASLDLAVGYGGVLHSDAVGPHLAALDVGASLGIRDFLVLRGALGYGLAAGDHPPKSMARGRVELAYLIDVLQWVPFFGLGAGFWLGDGAQGFFARGAGHAVVGLDYLATRQWTVGVDVRTGFLVGGSDVLSFTEGQLRLSRMFELF